MRWRSKHLNQYVLRSYVLKPNQSEEVIFFNYVRQKLKLSSEDADKFRELCLLSTDAVYYGQESRYFEKPKTWWVRDHYFTAINLKEVVEKNIQDKVIEEKVEYIKSWYKMEQLASKIKLSNADDHMFLQVSIKYRRIKYEIIEQIWRIQIIHAEHEAGKEIDKKYARKCIDTYEEKWKKWTQLKKENPSCPTLYVDHKCKHCGPPFQTVLGPLKKRLGR